VSEIVDEVFVEAAYVIKFGYEEYTLPRHVAEELHAQLSVLLSRGSNENSHS
jgi:hypothetical protein